MPHLAKLGMLGGIRGQLHEVFVDNARSNESNGAAPDGMHPFVASSHVRSGAVESNRERGGGQGVPPNWLHGGLQCLSFAFSQTHLGLQV